MVRENEAAPHRPRRRVLVRLRGPAGGEERDRTIREVERWNPQLSFPTVVVNDTKVVVGFREDEIREAVGA
jgi:glutaredoxin